MAEHTKQYRWQNTQNGKRNVQNNYNEKDNKKLNWLKHNKGRNTTEF